MLQWRALRSSAASLQLCLEFLDRTRLLPRCKRKTSEPPFKLPTLQSKRESWVLMANPSSLGRGRQIALVGPEDIYGTKAVIRPVGEPGKDLAIRRQCRAHIR